VSDDGKLVLSPFVVTESYNPGYAASSTLAGTRLTSNLKDFSSSITVNTKQFLETTGTPDAQGRMQYAAPSADAAEKPAPVTDALADSPAQGAASPAKKNENTQRDDDLPLPSSPQPPAPAGTPVETNAAKEPVSTFSLHVSDVSFRLAQAALAANESIDPAKIRPEEFYNAFSYGDPTPSLAEKVSCRIEQAAHPFLQQRNLVRIAVKVAASGREAAQPLHLTILLDTSGSMEREDRIAIVHRAMATLVSLLGANDRITLIGFARQPSLLAESVAGDQSKQILDVITHIPPEGGTNLEEALKLGGELARRQFEPNAQNRIVLLTDGAANLGNANPAQLSATIEKLRQQGIAFDACGVGFDGLDDTMLENLTRKGDGRYYVLNSPEAADEGFARQLAGAFRPAAENVKLQVRFNPARVGHYRLIGFEQHHLREEDFRNDKVDAAELAAGEAAVAVYQVEPLPQGEGDLGEVFVRFRDAASGNMVEHSWTLSYDPQAPAFDRATSSMQLAGVAALLAEKLRGGPNAGEIKLSDLAPVINTLRSQYASEPRVQELVAMFGQIRQRTGE
jgi:Mg-chelatase subunit ChlD